MRSETPNPISATRAQRAYQAGAHAARPRSATRTLLRALYSPNQLQEQMTWFWINHFNVTRQAHCARWSGDYEESAIRPHALGRFRDLLGATARHPAMLRYLDNAQNAREPHQRELCPRADGAAHAGRGGGYTQGDVQELARILTGRGRQPHGDDAESRPARQGALRARRACSSSTRTGTTTATRCSSASRSGPRHGGDRRGARPLARHPATARFISRKIARLLRGATIRRGAGRAHGAHFPGERRRHRRDAAQRCSRRPNSRRRSAASSRTRCITWCPRVRLAYDDKADPQHERR